MLHVKFSKDLNDKVIITDYNDEQLYVVAQALVDDIGRNKLKALLDSGNLPHDYTALNYSQSITLSVMPLDSNTIQLKLQNTHDLNEQTQALTIEIAFDTLQELISQWEDKDFEELSHLFLTRHGDVYTLSDHKNNL